MSIDRAWARRPLSSEPWYGRLLPPVWSESTITLSGPSTRVDDGHGGTTVGGAANYLTSVAHVEVVSVRDVSDSPMGPVDRSSLRVFLPWPPGRMPVRGDTITWTDDTGRTHRLSIRTVESPEGLHSHLEMMTEAFD